MILLLLGWAYYSFIFLLAGIQVRKLIEKISGTAPKISIFYNFWIGIAGVLFILSVVSLFCRVNFEAHTAILLFAVYSLVRNFNELKNDLREIYSAFSALHFLTKLVSVFLFFFVLFVGTDGPVYNLDPGRYHFQNILWAMNYPVVPGLANLHDRYGNSSSWYLLHSMAEFFPFHRRSYHIFNSLIFVSMLVYCVSAFDSLFKGDFSIRTFFLAFIFIYLAYYFDYIYFWYLSCPSPDFPVNLFAIVCFLILIDCAVSLHKKFFFLLYALLASQAFSARLSALYLLIPMCWLLYEYARTEKKNIRGWFFVILLSSILIIPVLIRNFILTGWILFPATVPDLLQVDWKVPENIAHGLMKAVATTGLIGDEIGQTEFEKISSMAALPHSYLLFHWFQRQILEGGFVYWLISGALVFSACLLIQGKTVFVILKNYFPVLLLSIASVLAWIFSSPNFRFGFGYVGIAAALMLSLSANLVSGKKVSVSVLRPFMIILFTILFSKIILSSTIVSLRNNGLYYPFRLAKYIAANAHPFHLISLPEPRYSQLKISASMSVNIPEWDSTYSSLGRNKAFVCEYADTNGTNPASAKGYNAYVGTMLWMTPLPASGGIREGLEPRSGNLKDGFRIRKKK